MYQIHNEDGFIQDLTTMQIFPPIKENREGRKYQAWLAGGNIPKPMAEPQKLLPNPLIAEVEKATTVTELKEIIKKML